MLVDHIQRAKAVFFGDMQMICPNEPKIRCRRRSTGATDPYGNSVAGLCADCKRDVLFLARAIRKAFHDGRTQRRGKS